LTDTNHNLRFFSGEFGSGNELSVNPGVSVFLLLPQVVTLNNLDRAALRIGTVSVTAEAAALGTSQIDSVHFSTGAVNTAALGADSVTSAKIADGAIDTAAQIANDLIDSQHLAPGGIDAEHIASDAVTTVKILDDNVTLAKLAPTIVSIGLAAGDAGDSHKASAVVAASTANGNTGIDIAEAPAGRVFALVNDVTYAVELSDTSTTFWFENSAGGTVRATWASVIATDVLHVNTTNLGYALAATDEITLMYSAYNA